MYEIRLRWSEGIQRDDGDEGTPGAGLWFPDNEENRQLLETVRECGEEAFGKGTHWIEKRQA